MPARRGQLPPFEAVITEHAHVVMRVCVAQAGRDHAEEVFQESMIAALRAYPELRDPGAVRGWLCAIAVRKAIDAHRARAARPATTELTEHLPAEPSAEAESGEAWAAVRELPDKQRTAVTLRYMAELTNAEIAQVMGTSTDAARRSVYEALEKLRAQIGDDLTTLGAAASQ